MTRFESPNGSGPGNPELEAAIFANQDDLDAWAVYGDWLQAQEDPRGEAVAIGVAQARGDSDPALEQRWLTLLKENQRNWLGPELSKGLGLNPDWRLSNAIELNWKFGFIHSAEVAMKISYDGPSLSTLVGDLLQCHSSTFLVNLSIEKSNIESGFKNCLSAIANCKERPALREFYLGNPDDDFIVGDVSLVLPVFPGLETLGVRGQQIVFKPRTHTNLKRFFLRDQGFLDAQICESNFPALEILHVWFGFGHSQFGLDDAWLSVQNFPALKDLTLQASNEANDMAEQIAGSPLLQQLESLDLSHGNMNDEGAKALLGRKENFKHLKHLNLEENFIGIDLTNDLRAAFGNSVNVRNQNQYVDGEEL